MTEAASYFEHRLPEVFAGFPRGQTRMPVVYPTASRPQAWAAGTPILLLQIVLGLRPDRGTRALVVDPGELSPWTEGLRLEGVHAFGRCWRVCVADGVAVVEEMGEPAVAAVNRSAGS
jgi:glycogen debranching enzyme